MGDIKKHHIEMYMVALLGDDRPGRFASANNSFRSRQQFFKWLHEVEIAIPQNPMDTMKPPRVLDKPIALLAFAELKRLVATCSSASFEDVRDEAAIRLMIDSGTRRSEVLSIECGGIDIDGLPASVVAKGGGTRTISFGRKTARARRRVHPLVPGVWEYYRHEVLQLGRPDPDPAPSRQPAGGAWPGPRAGKGGDDAVLPPRDQRPSRTHHPNLGDDERL